MLKKWLRNFVVWLYDLLEAERKRRAAEELVVLIADRETQARKNATKHFEAIQKRQNLCSHRKGTGKISGPSVDWNVARHTFPDGSTKTWCLICGKIFVGTEAEKAINWSTNTATSSEVNLGPKNDREQPETVILSGEHRRVWQYGENEPLAPYMSLSLWNRLMKRYEQLKKRKKVLTKT